MADDDTGADDDVLLQWGRGHLTAERFTFLEDLANEVSFNGAAVI